MNLLPIIESILSMLPYLGGIALIFLFYRMSYKKGYEKGIKDGAKEVEKLYDKTIGKIENRILNPSDDDFGRVLESKPEIKDIRKTDT